MERITYTTFDDVIIVGDWVTAPTTYGAVLLLHMMPADRKSWAKFQTMLTERGLASLAIDLRGHGESTKGPGDTRYDYKGFTDEEHQSSLNDVTEAFRWIRRRGMEPSKIAVCGASIGANLAALLLIEEPEIAGAALLSPGKDYHGLNVLEDAGSVLNHQAVWATGSQGDDQDAYDSAEAYVKVVSSDDKTFVPLENVGHGTTILENNPDIATQLADWLKRIILGG